MPLYQYRCEPCRAERSDIRLVAERHDGPACDRCGKQMTLTITPVPGIVKNPAVPRGKP